MFCCCNRYRQYQNNQPAFEEKECLQATLFVLIVFYLIKWLIRFFF